MGAQPDAVANARRGSGTGLLVRPIRFSRRFCRARRWLRITTATLVARRALRKSPRQQLPGDRESRATLERYMDRLARGLASVINVVDPDAIVLGGGLSSISALYEQVPRLWIRYIFSDRVATPLLPPVHGASQRRARRGVVVAAGRGAVRTLCRDCGALETAARALRPPAARRGWSAMPNSALWRSRMSIATRFMPPSKRRDRAQLADQSWRLKAASDQAAPPIPAVIAS